jgi:hypothetical protein
VQLLGSEGTNVRVRTERRRKGEYEEEEKIEGRENMMRGYGKRRLENRRMKEEKEKGKNEMGKLKGEEKKEN